MKTSRVPEGGWNQRELYTRNGRRLIQDLVLAERAVVAKGIRKLAPKLKRHFTRTLERVVEIFTTHAVHLYGLPPKGGGYMPGRKVLETITLDPGMHDALWSQALDEVLREEGLEFSNDLRNAIQSGVDGAYATTASLLGVGAGQGTRPVLNYEAQQLAQRITRITETTRLRFRSILDSGIGRDGLTPFEMAARLRAEFPTMATYRTAMIARTEMGLAADAGRKVGLRESEVVTHVSVIGCEAREARSPQYRGESTCNIEDVPIGDIDQLEFHPNHTGSIVPSRMIDATGEEVALSDLDEQEEIDGGIW